MATISSNTNDSHQAPPPQSTTPYQIIPPRTGTSLTLIQGQHLTILDPQGSQVSDLLAFNAHNPHETFSNGRTIDYNSHLNLTTGSVIYSNQSRPMLTITADTVGRHDFLFTPCCHDTFRLKYPDQEPHRGCFGNLAAALAPYGIEEYRIGTPFNCFMNVVVGEGGGVEVRDPLSRAGDYVVFRAEMDLVVGLTACAALRSNAGVCKEIWYRVE